MGTYDEMDVIAEGSGATYCRPTSPEWCHAFERGPDGYDPDGFVAARRALDAAGTCQEVPNGPR